MSADYLEPFNDLFLKGIFNILIFYCLLVLPAFLSSATQNKSSDRIILLVLLSTGSMAWLSLILGYYFPVTRFYFFPIILVISIFVCIFHGKLPEKSILINTTGLFGIGLLGAILTFSVGYLYGGVTQPLGVAAHRWFHWAADNEIPLLVARSLQSHDFNSILGGVQIGDRPPLQAAYVNLFAPFIYTDLDYQTFGIVLQSLCLPALYLLMRSFEFKVQIIRATLALVALSGFFIMNAFYVWPKLLAAAFLCAAVALIRKKDSKGYEIGILCAFALLSHGGSLIALLGIFLWAACKKYISQLPISLLICFVIISPWLLFTSYVQPPGNRLLKWHLAGIVKPDSRGSAEAIIDSYSSQTIKKIFKNKFENFKIQIIENSVLQRLINWKKTDSLKPWWDFQFIILFFAGFPAVLVLIGTCFFQKKESVRRIGELNLLWLLAITITCLLMFGPALDIDMNIANALPSLPQQSYFIPLVFLSACLISIQYLSLKWRRCAIIIQLLLSTPPYFFRLVEVPGMSLGYNLHYLALMCAISALLILMKISLKSDISPASDND